MTNDSLEDTAEATIEDPTNPESTDTDSKTGRVERSLDDSQANSREAVTSPKNDEIKEQTKIESPVTDKSHSLKVEQNYDDSQADF